MVKIKSMLNVKTIDSYEISPITMAVMSEEESDGTYSTFVFEEKQHYKVLTTPTKMIDSACVFYGSSLRGRLDGTKGISRITHKAPVAIDPASGIYFFPTMSPKHNACSWISHTHIKYIEAIEESSQTKVHFRNGESIIVDISFGSMLNQQHRTAQFRYALDLRLQKMQGKHKVNFNNFDNPFNN